jgi:hypothetical protein
LANDRKAPTENCELKRDPALGIGNLDEFISPSRDVGERDRSIRREVVRGLVTSINIDDDEIEVIAHVVTASRVGGTSKSSPSNIGGAKSAAKTWNVDHPAHRLGTSGTTPLTSPAPLF